MERLRCLGHAQAKKPASVSREDFGRSSALIRRWKGPLRSPCSRAEGEGAARIRSHETVDQRKLYAGAGLEDHLGAERAIISLARDIASRPEGTLFACGMGSNQYFNADLKDRAVLFVAAMTRNIGFPEAMWEATRATTRSALLNGVGAYVAEDPFNH